MPNKKCCFCGKVIKEFYEQNNPQPLNNIPGAVCCSSCNSNKVLPYRMSLFLSHKEEGKNKGE